MGKIKKFIEDHAFEMLAGVFGLVCGGIGVWLGYNVGKAEGFDDGVSSATDTCNAVFRMEATMLIDACKEGAVAGLTEDPATKPLFDCHPTNLDVLKEVISNSIDNTELVREFNDSADYKFVKIVKF